MGVQKKMDKGRKNYMSMYCEVSDASCGPRSDGKALTSSTSFASSNCSDDDVTEHDIDCNCEEDFIDMYDGRVGDAEAYDFDIS